MSEQKPQRQMVEMEVVETSGVDHPAHGFEGWLVKKSAGRGRVAALNRLLKGTVMATKEDLIKEVDGSKVPDSVKEFVKKSLDLTEDIDAAASLWQSLRAKQESQDPETPTTTDVATPAAPVAAAETPAAFAPDVFKSLDPEAQSALTKAAAGNPDLAKAFGAVAAIASDALEKAATERNERLDKEAISKSRDTLGNLSVEHEKLAPALRKMAETDPATADLITKALEGANVQVETAGLFSERGTARAAEGSAMEKARSVAASLVGSGTVKTIEEGLAKAFADNPDLYNDYEKEVG